MITGKFITLEGVDGSGKTVQVKRISEYLENLGINTLCLREPGGTLFGENIRNIILNNQDILPFTEVLLFFAARNELFHKTIKPALEDGIWVICDRFYDSTIAYQGILKNSDIEDIMKIKDMTMCDFDPDLTIIFDITTKEAKRRIEKRNISQNKYDEMDEEKYNKIIQGYKKISEVFSYRCAILKANKREDIVFEDIRNLLLTKFKDHLEKNS